MTRLITLLTVAVLLAACDRGPSRDERAKDRYALELADCAAYYAVMADCLGAAGPADQAAVVQTKVTALRAMRMSTELSSERIAQERVEQSIERINNALDNHCVDPLAVVEQYGAVCAAAVDDPDGRSAHWLAEID